MKTDSQHRLWLVLAGVLLVLLASIYLAGGPVLHRVLLASVLTLLLVVVGLLMERFVLPSNIAQLAAANRELQEEIAERKRAEALQTVAFRIADASNRVSNLEELLRNVRQELSSVIDTSNFYIAFVDPEWKQVSFPFYVDEHRQDPEFDPSWSRPFGRGLTEYVIRTGLPALLTAAEQDALIARGEIVVIGTPCKVWLGVPLMSSDRAIGVIAVQSYTNPAAYDQNDLHLLSFVSGQIGAMLERARAADELARSHDFYLSLLDGLPVLIWRSDATGRCVYCNRSYLEFTGHTLEEDLGEGWLGEIHPEDLANVRARFAGCLRRQEPLLSEHRLRRHDGEYRWVLDTGRPFYDSEGRFAGFVGACYDSTERKQAEALLQQQAAAIQASMDGVAILDRQGRYLYLNEAYSRVHGYDGPGELLGQSWKALYPSGELLRFERDILPQFQADGQWRGEAIGRKRDGSTFAEEVSLTAIEDGGMACVVRDITKHKRLEEQFHQSQKMEAVGRLAGGVAHDFNNLLTAIGGYASFARDAVGPEHPAYEDISQVIQSAERAANLTRQLLAFSRRQIITPQVVDLNEVILNLDKMLRRLISENIELVTLPEPDLGMVKIDPGQIEQVLLNLVVNARDAMPEGGCLTIETENVRLDEEYARAHAEVVPGDFVLLAVSDTGCGMSEQVKARLFEPFFTTKEVGKGTGLGLATCYGIVKQNGGHIWFYSEVGKGSTFKVYLPRVASPLASSKELPDAAPQPRGAQTILLVEDEAAVRSFAARVLREVGYTVVEATNGMEAMQAVSRMAPGTLQLLVTDVVMPQMGGKELARQLKQVHPEVKVLFVSGYTDNAIVHHGVLDEGVAFLQKPFTLSSLAQKVGEILSL